MQADIRPARASDIDALVAIENTAFAGDRMSRRSLSRLVGSRTAAVRVAARGAEPLGYAAVLFRASSRKARLYSIATAPSASGRGLGGALLGAAERAAEKRGCAALHLEVREDNFPAIRLYERNGYRRSGVRPDYYADGATALRYEKRLGSREHRDGTVAP
jgi:[ribosomal protein S18]-alanine N-acetyltransferase